MMNLPIAARFERIAERHADRTAVRTLGKTFTYREFNAEANRISRMIERAVGEVAPGRIALYFEQGHQAILSLMAVLKTGHAFVPLDAADGSDRMRGIIDDCQPLAMLTCRRHLAAARLLNAGNLPLICVDDLPGDLPDANACREINADADAYVFYTSGSTGRPKGVRQTQANLQHFADVYSRTLGITHEDRLTLFYSPAFSASNMDVFGALLNGAALFPWDIRTLGTAALADWLDENDITILHAVPTVYRHLVRQLPQARILKTIRGVDLGGEAVYATDVDLHRAHFREDCLLVNHLAATEASVIAQYRIPVSAVIAGEMLPVGPPADGMEIEILDDAGLPVRDGGAGEIMLRSRHISPGYLRQPELNANAFGDDASRPGWRTYRTGDVGYFSASGDLHFLGRKDHRVKVRGHTVDVAEIEAAIRILADVRDVAVVLKEDAGDVESGRLVAFLTTSKSPALVADDLLLALRQRLPAYMVPAAIVVLDKLPVTSSGKLDRMRLAEMEVKDAREGRAHEAPVGITEQRVAEVFQSLLKLERAGRDDDFFLSGGDSLRAMSLHVELEDRFKKSIPLGTLFANPTVKGIAALIDSLQGAADGMPPVLVPLRETGKNVPLFLTHGARGQAFVSPHFLSILGDEQPVYALQATGLNPEDMMSIQRMAAEYIKAIRQVQPKGPYFIGALCIGSLLGIEMARQLREAGETVGPLVLIDPPPNPPADRSIYKRTKELIIAHYNRFKNRNRLDERFIRQVAKRSSQGRIRLDVNDGEAMMASQRATLDFKIALLNYRLPVYDGPTLILGTTSRLGKAGADAASVLMKRLTGKSEIFNVGPKHGEIHDVGNELFAKQMRKVMMIVADYFSSQTPSEGAKDHS
jgi:amino acid adenylation domain-containing protein